MALDLHDTVGAMLFAITAGVRRVSGRGYGYYSFTGGSIGLPDAPDANIALDPAKIEPEEDVHV